MVKVNFNDNYSHPDCGVFYAETNIPGPGMSSGLDTLCVVCACGDVCGHECACVRYTGDQLNYIDSVLSDSKMGCSAAVLECNEMCECSAACGNRLVQLGPRPGLAVVPVGPKGYGLKTEFFILKGGFICEYAGELISREEARRRAKHDASNYIFILREHSSSSVIETIIDPTCIGNIGRYINHSCEPNAAIVPVRVESAAPRLGLFAVVDVQAGSEITYDYGSGASGVGTVPCQCLSSNCRGFLPFDKDLLS